jgi:hypothetical protein
MKFVVLIYNDPEKLAAQPAGRVDATLRDCLVHADAKKREGALLQSEILEDTRKARTIRVRNGRPSVLDGPFAETKEVLGGFNIIEAESMEEALKIAAQFPWADTGAIEVRPIRDMTAVRQSVGLS